MSTEYQKVNTLVNPSNKNLAFKVFSFEVNSAFDHLQRLNYYTVILINKGQGILKVDFTEYNFTQNTLMCFASYKSFMIKEHGNEMSRIVINFHPNFFCIHKHQKEVACNGLLFNDIYKPPFVILERNDLHIFYSIFEQMKVEMENVQLAQYELCVSFLKIFLIAASRLKVSQSPCGRFTSNLRETVGFARAEAQPYE